MCEWGATCDERAVEAAEGGGMALWATGVEVRLVVVLAYIRFPVEVTHSSEMVTKS